MCIACGNHSCDCCAHSPTCPPHHLGKLGLGEVTCRMCHIQRESFLLTRHILERFGFILHKCTATQATACSNPLISVIALGQLAAHLNTQTAYWCNLGISCRQNTTCLLGQLLGRMHCALQHGAYYNSSNATSENGSNRPLNIHSCQPLSPSAKLQHRLAHQSTDC